jgi:Alcohol dehydrogenase transcription factor Myb/SANT-like
MDVERLIESVSWRPVLHESNRKSYKDAEKKSVVWNDIAEELGMQDYNVLQFVTSKFEQKCNMM